MMIQSQSQGVNSAMLLLLLILSLIITHKCATTATATAAAATMTMNKSQEYHDNSLSSSVPLHVSSLKDVQTHLSHIGLTLDDICGAYTPPTLPVITTEYQRKIQLDTNDVATTSATDTNATANINKNHNEKNEGNDDESNDEIDSSSSSNDKIKNITFAILCVLFAALAAGLTMGLLSQDLLDLKIKELASANLEERKQAATLVPLIKDHHRLLVTLLLMNALANEALPLFLDKLVPAYMAVIISVTLVLFFGEIIPSAIFTGPNQLAISSNLGPLVKIALILLKPIAWPIAKALDYFLHHEDHATLEKYDRSELSALVRLQFEDRRAAKLKKMKDREQLADPFNGLSPEEGAAARARVGSNGYGNSIIGIENGDNFEGSSTHSTRFVKVVDEVMMVEGALHMHVKKVIDVMQPWNDVYCIPKDLILNEGNIVEIYRSGHSRIPVYDNITSTSNSTDDSYSMNVNRNICGIFMVRQLVIVNSHDNRRLSTLPLARPFVVSPSMNLVDLINLLQEGKGKVAIVCYKPDEAINALENDQAIPQSAEVVGLVTLEDCIEELIQEEIFDEYDKVEMKEYKQMKWVVGKWKTFVKKKKRTRSQQIINSRMKSVNESTCLLETV